MAVWWVEVWAGARVWNAWNPGFDGGPRGEALTEALGGAILRPVIGTNHVSTIIIID